MNCVYYVSVVTLDFDVLVRVVNVVVAVLVVDAIVVVLKVVVLIC